MTNRKITSEQFATDGTIDGNRIQTALDETEEFINNVPLDAVKEKYSLNYMVFTHLGADANVEGAAPHPPDVIGYARACPYFHYTDGSPAPQTQRVKGVERDPNQVPPYLDSAWVAGALSVPYVFTASVVFYRPVILDTLSLFMSNGVDEIPDVYPDPTPPGSGHMLDFWDAAKGPRGAGYQRIRVIVDTDDSTGAEDRTLNSKEYVLQDFQETYWSALPHATTSTMQPPNSVLHSPDENSIHLLKRDINIPFHQQSRVRFRIVIFSHSTNWADLAHRVAENMTFTVVYKEALKRG